MKTIEERSLMLARLMGRSAYNQNMNSWRPYSDGTIGRAQFAGILLRFPEVMDEILNHPEKGKRFTIDPTQANILDAILRMNGYDID